MNLKIYLFLGQCIYLYNIFKFSNAKALLGENVKQLIENEFSFVVSLGQVRENNTDYSHFCTGSLVSFRDVLTADYCLRHVIDYKLVRVSVGSIDYRRAKRYSVAFWLTFIGWTEYYNVTAKYSENDIAMIRLTQNVTEPIIPASITLEKSKRFADCMVTLVGWGETDTDMYPPVMQTGEVQLLDVKFCNNLMQSVTGRHIPYGSNVFCSQVKPYLLMSPGDAGGPVIYKNEIIGITITTYPYHTRANKTRKINVHHGMFHYRAFIHDFLLC